MTRQVTGWVLIAVGNVLWLAGALLYLGEISGFLPTVPLLSLAMTTVGILIASAGVSVVRHQPLVELEQRRTSAVILLLALLLFLPLLLGGLLATRDSLRLLAAHQAGAGRVLGWGAFTLIVAAILFLLIRELVGHVLDTGTHSETNLPPPLPPES